MAGICLVITHLAITRLNEKQRGQQVIVKLVVVKPKGLAICLKRMLEFSVKNAMAFFMSFWQWMQTQMSETWQLLSKIALLDGHPVKCLSRRDLHHNLGDGVGMIVQKHGHQ